MKIFKYISINVTSGIWKQGQIIGSKSLIDIQYNVSLYFFVTQHKFECFSLKPYAIERKAYGPRSYLLVKILHFPAKEVVCNVKRMNTCV